MALPYNTATRTSGTPGASFTRRVKKSPLQSVQGSPQGVAAPTLGKASPLFNATSLINKQYDTAQSRLGTAQQEAARSALENAQRQASMNGTTGAGFQTKIQQDAVNESAKPYMDQTSALASDRAGALATAGQAQDAMKEQRRQFDFSAGLQKYAATNEMDLSRLGQFINAMTAMKGTVNDKRFDTMFSSNEVSKAFSQAGYSSNEPWRR